MKLTKFEHACFTLEKDGRALVFDPGNWSQDFAVPESVTAVVLTHEHADHFDAAMLQDIIDTHPDAMILAPPEMADRLPGLPHEAIVPGSGLEIGSFRLRFFGGEHAAIHPDIQSVVNVGVLVDESLYYPGDSFALPDVPVKTLALPVTAPWLKISEPIDFMLDIQPELAFPVHDHIASDDGKALVDRMLGNFADKNGIRYERISGSVDLD